ncbi:hypothetical protein F7725_017980 [Dissostichus mawsoni]|uniref:Uncharacterized protein n=1 Tax=Dissostichus mawsoni TaxID=36200 RepID=A0A7J5XR02_DISMA|nr:hypothetical protein F7725_017980 [Dissostichus mawsoni]
MNVNGLLNARDENKNVMMWPLTLSFLHQNITSEVNANGLLHRRGNSSLFWTLMQHIHVLNNVLECSIVNL